VYSSDTVSVIRDVVAIRLLQELRDPVRRRLALTVGCELVDDAVRVRMREPIHTVAKVVLVKLLLTSSLDSAM
jgi:hypothetical protein